VSHLNYQEIKNQFEIDNSSINTIYEAVIVEGYESYSSFEEYSSIIQFLITKFLQFNDYLHSNNLLQIYKINRIKSQRSIPEWMEYYSIKIYSKRSITFYLNSPHKFWEVVYNLASSKDDYYVPRLDNLIVDTLEFYKRKYVEYPEFLHDSLSCFVRYYRRNKSYSTVIDEHIKEIEILISIKDKENIADAYLELESRRTDESINAGNVKKEVEIVESDNESTDDKFYSDINLNDEEDQKKIIMIVGDDKFVHNNEIIYGIGKEYNVSKNQFEIINDYSKIKASGEKIIQKTQWNDKYIGIIFGSSPHSTTGKEDASSLIMKVTSTPGFPKSVICRQNNDGGKPKITKQSFKNALKEIIIAYKSR
jgi:hypothetical protein